MYYKNWTYLKTCVFLWMLWETLYKKVVWWILKICVDMYKHHLHPNITYTFPGSVTLIITMHISYGICPMKYWPLQRNKSAVLEEVPQYCRIQFVCKRTDIARVYCCDIAALYLKHRCSVSFCNGHIHKVSSSELSQYTTGCYSIKNAFYFCYILVYAHCNTLSHEHCY